MVIRNLKPTRTVPLYPQTTPITLIKFLPTSFNDLLIRTQRPKRLLEGCGRHCKEFTDAW